MRARLAEGVPLEVGARSTTPVLGVEHEFRVFDGTRQLDFAQILHNLPVEGLRLDPTDPNAYRTPWGGLLTADGREAEVAIAPVELRPGCTAEVEWRLDVAHRSLLDALPARMELDGYSTHLNVEVDDHDVVAAGRLFTRKFAPAMMLLLDRATSPGLLVRPRCGRLELGGEYCHGEQLRVAAAFAAAAGLTCAAAVRSRRAMRELPPSVWARVKPSNIRAGWYVDRRAFGCDLYAGGRDARLRYGFYRTWTAQEHLEVAWACARAAVESLLDDEELTLVDRVVDGTKPIPLESAAPASHAAPTALRSPFEGVIDARRRPGYEIEPASIAWDAVAFRVRGPREAIACVPRAALASFLVDLDAGRLDGPIGQFLASPQTGLVLQASDQTDKPGLFDSMASFEAIVPPERVPGHRVGGTGAGTPKDARRNKNRRGKGPKRALVAVGAVLAAAAIVGGVVLATSGGSSKHTNVAAGGAPSQSTPAGAAAFQGKYSVTFTVVSVTKGADFLTNVPAVGSATTGQIYNVQCDASGCRLALQSGSPPVPSIENFGFPPLTGSGDHLTGEELQDQGGNCLTLNAVIFSAAIDLQHDANGQVSGFTGTNDVHHRDGLFEDKGNGTTCASYDVSYSVAGQRIG